MHLKSIFYIFLCSLFLTSLSSCERDSSFNPVFPPSSDAELIGFSLNHLLLPELEQTKFSINQRTAEIYNHDSLPYLSKIPYAAVVIYVNGRGESGNLQTFVEDSLIAKGEEPVWIKSGDSLALNETGIVRFNVVSETTSKKTYTLRINVHQIDPDSMQYAPVESNLFSFIPSGANNKTVKFKDTYFTYVQTAGGILSYQSKDMIIWKQDLFFYDNIMTPNVLPKGTIVKEIKTSEKGLFALTEEGELYISTDATTLWQTKKMEYPVKSILGYMPASGLQREGLALIVEKDDDLVFAFIPELFNTSETSNKYGRAVPANFPISDFSAINNLSNVINRITVVNGISSSKEDLNNVWTTEDGLNWVLLTRNQGSLPIIKGGNAFIYNGRIYFAGGLLVGEENTFNENIYTSRDGGMTWQQEAEKAGFPDSFERRMNASLVVDNEGIYFYIIGGMKENGTRLTDIWKGAINSRTFQK